MTMAKKMKPIIQLNQQTALRRGIEVPISMATVLNSGRSFRWSKKANAVRVHLPNGKTATVLKGDEDTLTGTGIDDNAVIEFGWVPFDRQQRPDRSRFVVVQSAMPTTLDVTPDPTSDGNSVLVTGAVHAKNGRTFL